jgi:hypothetical protein
MASGYMPTGYVNPKPGLPQKFETTDFEALSPSELAEVEKRTNPHGVVTKNIILTKDFCLDDLKKEGFHIDLTGPASRVFVKGPVDAKTADGLRALNKDETANSAVPEKLLVLNVKCTARHTNLPFATEGTIRGLKPSMKTNNDSISYTGSHIFVPAKADNTSEIEIHSAPKNLALVSALAVHKVTEQDLDDHIIGDTEYNGKNMHVVKITKDNPMCQIFAGEAGVKYIREKMPSPETGVRLVAHDENSPIITLVPSDVMGKARRAIINAKAETEKHVQSLPAASFGIEVSPATEVSTDFSQILNHPYFKNKSDSERDYEMKKPRHFAIGLSITYIPQ